MIQSLMELSTAARDRDFKGVGKRTKYTYDEAGRQQKTIALSAAEPAGIVTWQDYDGLGRVIYSVRNAGDSLNPAPDKEVTAYCYDDAGRLIAMAALLPDYGTITPGVQIPCTSTPTGVTCGIGAGTAQVTGFVYGADVVDHAGSVISAHNGWIKSVHYPDPATGLPKADPDLQFQYHSDGTVATRTDADGIAFRYQYDELGRRTRCTIEFTDSYHEEANPVRCITYSYSPDGQLIKASAYQDDTATQLVSENVFDYTGDNLVAEHQSHAGAVAPGTTPAVGYGRTSSPYASGNYERLTSITYPTRPDSSERRTITFRYGPRVLDDALSRIAGILDSAQGDASIAEYEYMGLNRRVSRSHGATELAQTVADSTGCTGLDRFGRITDLRYTAAGHELHRYQYGYDGPGNRTFTRVTQQPTPGSPPVPHVNDRSWRYGYDALDRLIQADFGKLNDTNTAIVPDSAVPEAIRATWDLDPLGNWAVTQPTGVTEPADPNYLYSYVRQYESDGDGDFDDALTSVNQPASMNNRIGHVAENGLQSDGFVYDRRGNLIWDGNYVYAYDAFSRLVGVYERGSALFDAATGQITDPSARGPSKAQFRYDGLGRLVTYHNGAETEHYYYDGVRRIQTTVVPDWDPQRIETRSEYVYGPDYVDEFILQSWKWTDSQSGQTYFLNTYILQDANYNVVALTEETGIVTDQYVWEPYGTLLNVDTQPIPPPQPALTKSIGHQGLFFYRFDSSTGAPLAPDAVGLYYNRNRWYSPRLGRFTTPDPNETAQLVVSAMAMNGDAWSLLADAFSPQGHFGDGMNLYGFAASNPLRNGDPLGLVYDPFEAVDDWTSERAGNALYTLGVLNESARFGLRASLAIAQSLIPGFGLYEAFKSVKVIADGQGGFWDAVNIATAVIPLAKGVLGIRSLMKARKIRAMGCNCFVAGTPVNTPDGTMSIESVQDGDVILTRHEDDVSGAVQPGRVSRVFRSIAPAILWITLSSGQTLGTTPGHEVWTYEHGWGFADALAPGDTFTGLDGQPVQIAAIILDPTPTPVYNLEVERTWTYFVDSVWVHNNSCPAIRPLNRLHGGSLHQSLGQQRIKVIQAQGATKVRWNQALVDSSGKRVSNVRPDIQYVGADGKVHIEDIVVSGGGNRGGLFQQLLQSDFGSYLDVYPP